MGGLENSDGRRVVLELRASDIVGVKYIVVVKIFFNTFIQ